ncbi:putative exodeoxyribonuclease protein [Corchorus olitorius]|uniref:Exodeoxyribonuclease protein n=1 Tax=Corchorus olitorius TaxID=93759 RepID=A0A1R3KJG9_9ROSI|nr:putative exodeoxyribonuclease protein [Corchorus olitorius]
MDNHPLYQKSHSSDEEIPFNITGNNILQAHFFLTATPHMFTGTMRYDLINTTGHEASPCPLRYHRDSWGRAIQPPSVSILAYNAAGIQAPPVHDYISSLANWYRPHLLFIIETRVPPTDVQDFANLVEYNLVTTIDSIRGVGGVWILSRPNHAAFQLVIETEAQIRLNMQVEVPRQFGQ